MGSSMASSTYNGTDRVYYDGTHRPSCDGRRPVMVLQFRYVSLGFGFALLQVIFFCSSLLSFFSLTSLFIFRQSFSVLFLHSFSISLIFSLIFLLFLFSRIRHIVFQFSTSGFLLFKIFFLCHSFYVLASFHRTIASDLRCSLLWKFCFFFKILILVFSSFISAQF